MSQQGRREPASDLPLRELGCDSRHLALPLHVFSWLPSLAWITAVTSPLSWYEERKSPPSWWSGACGLQRLIAPRLVFSPGGQRLLPLPFQHKAQLIAHKIKLQQSVRRSVWEPLLSESQGPLRCPFCEFWSRRRILRSGLRWSVLQMGL